MELIYKPNTTWHEITKWWLWAKHIIASTILMTIHLNFTSMVPILNSSRPPSYGCDLYLGLKRSCRAPAHQGQADDMSYCHSPYCLVTPHDVILKTEKIVHYSGANKYMPISTLSYILWLVQLASFSRSYTRSMQASTRTSQALNKLCIPCAHIWCYLSMECWVQTHFQAFHMWEIFRVNACNQKYYWIQVTPELKSIISAKKKPIEYRREGIYNSRSCPCVVSMTTRNMIFLVSV